MPSSIAPLCSSIILHTFTCFICPSAPHPCPPPQPYAPSLYPVADLKGPPGPCPSLQSKILSISCSLSENLAKSYVSIPACRVGTPSYGEFWIHPWYPLHTSLCTSPCLYQISNWLAVRTTANQIAGM